MAQERTGTDKWAKWVLGSRYGATDVDRQLISNALLKERDRILDRVTLSAGQHFLDLGCGEGLLGFGALEREPTASVIFADISRDLVEYVEKQAQRLDLAGRCTCLVQNATKLDALPNASVDIVAMRSLLIYLQDHPQVLKEFWRVLSPNGQLVRL